MFTWKWPYCSCKGWGEAAVSSVKPGVSDVPGVSGVIQVRVVWYRWACCETSEARWRRRCSWWCGLHTSFSSACTAASLSSLSSPRRHSSRNYVTSAGTQSRCFDTGQGVLCQSLCLRQTYVIPAVSYDVILTTYSPVISDWSVHVNVLQEVYSHFQWFHNVNVLNTIIIFQHKVQH